MFTEVLGGQEEQGVMRTPTDQYMEGAAWAPKPEGAEGK